MRMQDILKLHNGDEVFWEDPDEGGCSRHYTIATIEVKGDVVCIEDVDGDYLECLPRELK